MKVKRRLYFASLFIIFIPKILSLFMKKKIIGLCSLLLLLNYFSASSQSFMQSLGLTPALLFAKDQYGNKFSLYQTNFTYFPRYNFVANENSSISIGAPVGAGIGIVNSSSGDPGIGFSFDLPAVLDYNIGCKSTPENETYFGGYLGAGFGYSQNTVSGTSYSNIKATSYGPLFRAGVRIGSAKENWRGHAITIGFYYKKGLEAAKYNTVGCNVLVDL